jgi:O-acetyl-ADP-ribose deacetylase (regulator of RNase III)
MLREHVFESEARLQINHGDLTEERVDAIVNAANANLQHGGGVARAIVRKGGFQIQSESDEWVRNHGPISQDSPAYTSGGTLPCRYVIHAVGPVWGEGDEDRKLSRAITSALELADRLGIATIAFPAISTGIFGFPKERAASIILSSFHDYFTSHPESDLEVVRLTLFDQSTLDAFLQAWDYASDNMGTNKDPFSINSSN